MVTRQYRLSEFNTDGYPDVAQQVELLCEDHCGTYTLPFLCRWGDGVWIGVNSEEPIQATVVGWRERG